MSVVKSREQRFLVKLEAERGAGPVWESEPAILPSVIFVTNGDEGRAGASASAYE